MAGLSFVATRGASGGAATNLEQAISLAQERQRPIMVFLRASWSGESLLMREKVLNTPQVQAAVTSAVVFLEVDRDEQPHLDAALQAAFAAINGRPGGYPLTVFCTPEGVPFEALGYVPLEGPEGGLGMVEVVDRISALWSGEKDAVDRQAARVRRVVGEAREASDAIPVSRAGYDRLVRSMLARVGDNGWFSVGGTTVPLSVPALMLSAGGQIFSDPASSQGAERILTGVMRSAVRDHMQGGYFRSASIVDGEPIVSPEKLLSVQAAWLRALCAGHTRGRRARHLEGIREVLRFVRAQMELPDGGWRAYLPGQTHLPPNQNPWYWSAEDVRNTGGLEPREAEVVIRYYGLAAGRRSVARPVSLLQPVARSLSMTYDQADNALGRARTAASLQRQASPEFPQPPPLRILQWEGAMITSYILAAQATGDTVLRDHALESARGIASRDVAADGSIPRIVLEGRPVVPGVYADYVSVGEGLLSAYFLSEDPAMLAAARKLLERAGELRKASDRPDRPFLERAGERLFNAHDSDLPSPLSVGAAALMSMEFIEPGNGSKVAAEALIREAFEALGGQVGPGLAGAGWSLVVRLSAEAN